jgi:hypothetical protein
MRDSYDPAHSLLTDVASRGILIKSGSNSDPKTSRPEPPPAHYPHDAIRHRAEEIYIRNGRLPGRDLENWAQAEQEILRESAEPTVHRTAIVVRVEGSEYVGEYNAEVSDGYRPGEFGPGASIPVRFDGDKMLVLRPNGKVLETTIVNQINEKKIDEKKIDAKKIDAKKTS